MKPVLILIALGLNAPLAALSTEPAAWVFDEREILSGGATTTKVLTERAYSQFAANLDFIQQGEFKRGDLLFRGVHRGLGPLYNAPTCQTCHIRDGRGHPPADGDELMVSMLLRLSIPGPDLHSGVIPESVYGDQLQPQSVDGAGEGFAFIDYEVIEREFPDGETYTLRQPVYKIRELSRGDFDSRVMFSPRVAPPVFGLGLLEAIPESALLANADPDDADGDGISGRPNTVWDVFADQPALGRFGWKANQPSILQQLAGAYFGDIGVANPIFPGAVCAKDRADCSGLSTAIEATPLELALVEFYNRTLGVPRRRNADDKTVLAGKRVFHETGCAGCHVPSYRTGELAGSVLGAINGLLLTPDPEPVKPVSNQLIWPYTDLLLHDMGGACQPVVKKADDVWTQRCTGLADGRPDYQATGSEWRTPPLWGIGLVKAVNPRAAFLHDGRARTLQEAILWHGGEAAGARQKFMNLSKPQRQTLLRFLESL